MGALGSKDKSMASIKLSKFKIAFDRFVEIYGDIDPELSDLKLFYEGLDEKIVVSYEAEVTHGKGYEYEWFGRCLFKVDDKNE